MCVDPANCGGQCSECTADNQPSQLAEYRRKVAAGEIAPPEHKTPWQKLREAPTLKRRIVAFCHNCMGWEEGQEPPPGIRTDIKNCTAAGCPLFDARPYRS